MLANRRVHLIAALALVGAGIARRVVDALGIAELSSTAVHVCVGTALSLGAVIVTVISRSPHAFALRAIGWSSIAGALVGLLTDQWIAAERPNALLSFAGVEASPALSIFLGLVVGGLVGALIAAFAALSRKLNAYAPQYACITAWSLAALVSLVARGYIAIAPCILGAAIQLASLRRQRQVPVPVRPYR